MPIHDLAQSKKLASVTQRLNETKADEGNKQMNAVTPDIDGGTDGDVGIAPWPSRVRRGGA